MSIVFKELKKFLDEPQSNELDLEWVSEIRSMVTSAIMRSDHDTLSQMQKGLTPLARQAIQVLQKNNIPKWCWEVPEVVTLNDLVTGAIFKLTRVEPAQSLQRISHGAAVLETLIELNRETPLHERKTTLGDIRRRLLDHSDEAPSEATISRVLFALEEAGFVQRLGTTKGRRLRVLPKAEKISEKHPKQRLENTLKFLFELLYSDITINALTGSPDELDRWKFSREEFAEILQIIKKSPFLDKLEEQHPRKSPSGGVPTITFAMEEIRVSGNDGSFSGRAKLGLALIG